MNESLGALVQQMIAAEIEEALQPITAAVEELRQRVGELEDRFEDAEVGAGGERD
jgi:hypothetical protein